MASLDADWSARRDALRENSIAAMTAAIEVYNKPKMAYRSECFVILMINSWELLFKAILTKNQIDIFQKVNGDGSGSSIGLREAMKQSKGYFPESVSPEPIVKNIECINKYRNLTVHFYNEKGFDLLLHCLAQTSLSNYRELVSEVFQQDLADEVDFVLLPLSFATPPDPIQFLRSQKSQKSKVVAEYIHFISETTRELESKGADTGQFLTVFNVGLQSQKKIAYADIVGAVSNEDSGDGTFLTKTIDPNKSFPLSQTDILKRVGKTLHGVKFTSHTFQAIVWCHRIKENSRFHWELERAGTHHYSYDLVTFLRNNLSKSKVEECLHNYAEERQRNRTKRVSRT